MTNPATPTKPSSNWSNLFKKEDWWAVWLGLGIVLAAIFMFKAGTSLKPIAMKVPTWSEFSTVSAHFAENIGGYLLLFIVLTAVFSIAIKTLGHNLKEFIVGFAFVFIMSVVIMILGSNTWFKAYNLEAPLVALALGLIIGNFIKLPKFLNASLRTEFYVKTGIVLLGATLPFTLILQAGPMAFGQATLIAVSTFLTIYWSGTKLYGLDRRFASTLAAGGSICGVSASIAIGGAVKAEQKHVSVAISLVVVWAVVMIFTLPIVIKTFNIPSGPAGAWIGTSEFADAAGMAAAAAIDEQAIRAFTLMKVVGRDMFIGIWCFILAFISITKWEKREDGAKPDAGEIWQRFPKFVLGFFIASGIVSVLMASADAGTVKLINSDVISPVKTLRTWTFIFCFFCIGLTTRFKELTSVGWKPFAAFTTGVAVNVPLGFLLSVVLLGSYWSGV